MIFRKFTDVKIADSILLVSLYALTFSLTNENYVSCIWLPGIATHKSCQIYMSD